MGLESSNRLNTKYYRIISKTDDINKETRQCIVQVERVSDEYKNTNWGSSVSGWLVEMSIKDVKYKKAGVDSIMKKFAFILQDDEGRHQVEAGTGNAAYGILNCLLEADLTKKISIEAYVNKGGFVNGVAKYYGMDDSIPWAIPVTHLPKPAEYTTPSGKQEKDYGVVENFWIEQMQDIKKRAVHTNFPRWKEVQEEQKEQDKPSQGAYTGQQAVNAPPPAARALTQTPPPPKFEDNAFDDDLPF